MWSNFVPRPINIITQTSEHITHLSYSMNDDFSLIYTSFLPEKIRCEEYNNHIKENKHAKIMQ